jgi:hypothetical protein
MLDQMVQGILIRRVILHWFVCLASTALAAWVWSVWSGRPQPSLLTTLRDLAPALLGSLLILPLAVADMLRTSNRFVGPVLRMRNAMKRRLLGDSIAALRPRRDDFWSDLFERFNQLQRQWDERPKG